MFNLIIYMYMYNHFKQLDSNKKQRIVQSRLGVGNVRLLVHSLDPYQ